MSSDGWRACDELDASAGAAKGAMDAADGGMLGGMADDSSGLLFCELFVSIALFCGVESNGSGKHLFYRWVRESTVAFNGGCIPH